MIETELPSIELLHQLFYVNEKQELCRKLIPHMGYSRVTSWNTEATLRPVITPFYVSLKVIGRGTFYKYEILEALLESPEQKPQPKPVQRVISVKPKLEQNSDLFPEDYQRNHADLTVNFLNCYG